MASKIIINSDESIICPNCSRNFLLNEAIAKQTIEKYESEYENEAKRLKLELSEAATKEAEKNVSKKYSNEIQELKDTLIEKNEKLDKLNQKVEQAREESRKEALSEFTNEKKILEEKLKLKETALNEYHSKEVSLVQENEKLIQEKNTLELEYKKQLNEEKEKIKNDVAKQKEDEFKLREIEFQNKLLEAQSETKQMEKNISKKFEKEIEDLKESLNEKDEKIEKTNQRIEKVKEEARTAALEDAAIEKNALEEKLKIKENAITEFRDKELKLIQKNEKLEEEKSNLDLEYKRKMNEERESIKKQAFLQKEEEFKLKEAEYQKKLTDAQKANEKLSKKLENKSQQFTGEVLEIVLEETLKSLFPQDNIQPVRKGVKGADVLQMVFNNLGQNCGKILWEAKRHEKWQDNWLQKLKDDQIEANAEIALIVTTVMPKECNELYTNINDIWVVSDQLIKPFANTLRYTLLETNKQKQLNIGKDEKKELVYNYLNSPQFVQKVKSVLGTFINMKLELDKEKVSINKIWKKRETQIERVVNNISSMVGELQGLSQGSLSELESIDQLMLPEADIEPEDAN
ncbi:MAG: DUF2130 domain-containing protein [Ignavibacteria bacterium]|jgi:hypothetical protein